MRGHTMAGPMSIRRIVCVLFLVAFVAFAAMALRTPAGADLVRSLHCGRSCRRLVRSMPQIIPSNIRETLSALGSMPAGNVWRQEKLGTSSPLPTGQREPPRAPASDLSYVQYLDLEDIEVLNRTIRVRKRIVDLPKPTEHRYYPGQYDGGARSEDGKPGYVADPTSAKKAAGAFTAKEGDCTAGDLTWEMMNQHMHLAVPPVGWQPRIMCLVVAHNLTHETKLRTVRDTWGKDCDGFLALSNKTDASLGALNLTHIGIESWHNVWQKVRASWAYAYEHYYSDYDFFIMGGDDLFVVVENLRAYLARFDPDGKPLYLGRPSKEWRGGKLGGDEARMFNLGGAGYVLNAAALRLLYSRLLSPECNPSGELGAEDTQVAMCLRASGVKPRLTWDELGRERFLPFTPDGHASIKPPADDGLGGWYEQTALELKFGFECCSQKAISYHYVPAAQMRRVYAILHGHCGKDRLYDAGPGGTGSLKLLASASQPAHTALHSASPAPTPAPKPPRAPASDLSYVQYLDLEDIEVLNRTIRVRKRIVDLPKPTEHRYYPGQYDGGARSEDGKPGYVADPTSAKKAAGAFTAKEGDCTAGDLTWEMMNQHMHLAVPPVGWQPRIMCLVVAHNLTHETKLRTVRDTWGKDCDGFLALSNKTDASLGALNLTHIGIESWHNVWQKVRASWAYAYEHYYSDYDFFIMGGDDLFVVVENLRAYLARFDPDGKPLYLGRPSKEWRGGKLGGDEARMFNLGGAGYVLNAAALRLLYSRLLSPECNPSGELGAEDTQVAMCLRASGVKPRLTWDELGRERFLPFTPDGHASIKPPADDGLGGWYEQTALELKFGFECCSQKAISYHYVPAAQMRRVYAILHGHCGKDRLYDAGPGGTGSLKLLSSARNASVSSRKRPSS